jgi:putative flippase GtrA
VSYLCAVTTTWWLNRTYTFTETAGKPRVREWGRYAVSQLGGGSVNYLVYAGLVYAVPLVERHPVLGVAAGSAAGLVVNFLLARRYVFR